MSRQGGVRRGIVVCRDVKAKCREAVLSTGNATYRYVSSGVGWVKYYTVLCGVGLAQFSHAWYGYCTAL